MSMDGLFVQRTSAVTPCESFMSHGPTLKDHFRPITSSAVRLLIVESQRLGQDNSFSRGKSETLGSSLWSHWPLRLSKPERVIVASPDNRITAKAVVTSPAAVAGGAALGSGMKRLILLRHAKSSWTDASLKDHDRPLSKRGSSAAGHIAVQLADRGWVPTLILCSDSVRTRQTLARMGEAVSAFRKADVRFLGSYYSIAAMDGQTAKHLHDTILEYATSETGTVMCMGHNRGWEEAASDLSGKVVELKTANAALLETNVPAGEWEAAWKAGWKLKEIVKPQMVDC